MKYVLWFLFFLLLFPGCCELNTDNHDQHSNSSSHSMPHAASSTHSTSMPTITSATSSASVLNVTKKTDHQSHDSKGDIERDVDDNGDDGADGGESHQQPVVTRSKQSASGETDSVAGVKDKMEHSTHSDMLLEPKNEYDESNEGNVEDLTLDDEELLDDLEQAGPSHGGEGSSQGLLKKIDFSTWEIFGKLNVCIFLLFFNELLQDTLNGKSKDLKMKCLWADRIQLGNIGMHKVG